MNGSGASYASETVWNAGYHLPACPANGEGYWGSGGRVSTYYSIPSWQQGVNMSSIGGSTVCRNIPDVALTADNIWVIHNNGQTNSSAGTSASAPLWAGFTALVNQQAAASNRPPVGFLNPSLYRIAQGPNCHACFHDVTTGNNAWPGSLGDFQAVPGYDPCTGLGTPKGTSLIAALLTLPPFILTQPN
jgi:kumamolisin